MGRQQGLDTGERQIFSFRYGPGVPVLGMRRKGADAGSVQLPYFLYLRNARFDDGIGGRPSHEVFQNGFGGDQVYSLFDFQHTAGGAGAAGGGNKLYVIFSGCPGIAGATSGQSLNWYSYEPLDPFSRGVYWSSEVFESCMGIFDGRLLIGRGELLSAFVLVEGDYEGDDLVFLAGFDQAELLKTFTGFTLRSICSAFGEVFLGLENQSGGGIGNSKVVRYDGITFRDDLTAIDPPSAMLLFRNDTLAMTFSTAAGGLHLRNAAGTWSNVAGALGNVQCTMAEFGDELYITESSADLWKYDGTTLAVDHSIATAVIASVATAFGYLFYGHDRGAANLDATIGRLDSAGTYVDVHKNIATQTAPPDFSWARQVKRLAFYRGALIAGVESVAYGGRLFLSRGDDTDGTWDIVTPVDLLAPGYGGIVAFQVF